MKYLVTGGAGLSVSNIVNELLKQGQEVRVLVIFFATAKLVEFSALLKDQVTFDREGDLEVLIVSVLLLREWIIYCIRVPYLLFRVP